MLEHAWLQGTVRALANAVEARDAYTGKHAERVAAYGLAIVAGHAEIGSKILRHVDFLDEATLIVRHHHERWDGTGYPDGLKGEQIPLVARVFAIADTIDAYETIGGDMFARLGEGVRSSGDA